MLEKVTGFVTELAQELEHHIRSSGMLPQPLVERTQSRGAE